MKKTPDLPPVTTIHRFTGILDGRYTEEELLNLIEESESHHIYRENIRMVQVLIIG